MLGQWHEVILRHCPAKFVLGRRSRSDSTMTSSLPIFADPSRFLWWQPAGKTCNFKSPAVLLHCHKMASLPGKHLLAVRNP